MFFSIAWLKDSLQADRQTTPNGSKSIYIISALHLLLTRIQYSYKI